MTSSPNPCVWKPCRPPSSGGLPRTSRSPGEHMSSPTDTRDPLDHSQIEFLLSLDDGQGEALAEIVQEYLLVCDEGYNELLRLVSEGDRAAIERTAHTLKGASANVGATGL